MNRTFRNRNKKDVADDIEISEALKNISKRARYQMFGEFHPEKKMIYVFAGDSRLASGYARKMQILRKDFRCIEMPQDLYGVRDVEVHRVTTWQRNRNADEINDLLKELEKRGYLEVIDVEW